VKIHRHLWRLLFASVFNSQLNYAREEGMEKEKLEIARKMKKMGDSIEKIQAITELPTETIESM